MSMIPGYWFGEPPPDGVQAAYGCRAILSRRGRNQYVDIVWDRQSVMPSPVPAAFEKFVTGKLSNWLNPTPKQRSPKIGYVDPAGDEVFTFDDGIFHAKACANCSYGYLYVGAWMDASASTDG